MPRKLEPEAINERIKDRLILMVGPYTNTSTKTKFRCLVDGHEWETTPNSVLRGSGCLLCARLAQRNTKEEINKKIVPLGKKLIGEYHGMMTKTVFRCSKGHEWEAQPNSVVNHGTGCPRCTDLERRWTFERLSEEIRPRLIELASDFVTVKTKTKFRCLVDGHEWKATPDSVLRGSGCPLCAKLARRGSKENIIERVKPRGFSMPGEYHGMTTKTVFRCSKGHEWEAQPNSVVNHGTGCPRCTDLERRWTFERLSEEIRPRLIELASDFVNVDTKTKFRCLVDGHEWETTPTSVVNGGTGCPRCNSASCDANVVYLYRIPSLGDDVYKIGISSQGKEENRLRGCASKNGWVIDRITFAYVEDARSIERDLLEFGIRPELPIGVDGRTEVRILTDDEYRFAVEYLNSVAVPADAGAVNPRLAGRGLIEIDTELGEKPDENLPRD